MFRVLGLVFLILIAAAGTMMRFPETPSLEEHKPLPLSTVARDSYFWLLFLTMFAGLIAGFTINTNMTKLYSGPDKGAGVMAVFLFAVASATGRVLWGFFFDRVRPTTAVKLNLLAQTVLLLGSGWVLHTTTGYKMFAFLTGFNYGGLLVVHASSSARHWGGRHVGQVYGWLSGSNIPAAMAPILAGMAFDRWGSFKLPFYSMAIFLILIIVVFQFKTQKMADR